MMPSVSMIIPVYNGARHVTEAIESALAQTYPDFELIIANDGSSDNSRAIIAPYCVRPNVHCFEQPNAGVAAARNAAIRHAKDELIAFLDQDDHWLPGKLEHQVIYLAFARTACKAKSGPGKARRPW